MSVARRWKALALLSVIVPIGLLLGFRLTGVFQGSPEIETITVNPVFWNMSRLSGYTIIEEEIRNSYINKIVFKFGRLCYNLQ